MARGLLGAAHPLQMRHKRREALAQADCIILVGTQSYEKSEPCTYSPRTLRTVKCVILTHVSCVNISLLIDNLCSFSLRIFVSFSRFTFSLCIYIYIYPSIPFSLSLFLLNRFRRGHRFSRRLRAPSQQERARGDGQPVRHAPDKEPRHSRVLRHRIGLTKFRKCLEMNGRWHGLELIKLTDTADD